MVIKQTTPSKESTIPWETTKTPSKESTIPWETTKTPSKESTIPWETKTTVGANWKMHTLDTKPTNEGDKGRDEVKVRNDIIIWNKQESCETDSVTHKEHGRSFSHEITDTMKVPLPVVSTPEMGVVIRSGRTSACSVSSLSDVSVVGGAKRGGGVSRSTSPRKINRWVWSVVIATLYLH